MSLALIDAVSYFGSRHRILSSNVFTNDRQKPFASNVSNYRHTVLHPAIVQHVVQIVVLPFMVNVLVVQAAYAAVAVSESRIVANSFFMCVTP